MSHDFIIHHVRNLHFSWSFTFCFPQAFCKDCPQVYSLSTWSRLPFWLFRNPIWNWIIISSNSILRCNWNYIIAYCSLSREPLYGTAHEGKKEQLFLGRFCAVTLAAGADILGVDFCIVASNRKSQVESGYF